MSSSTQKSQQHVVEHKVGAERKDVARLGFWSAILTTVVSAAFFVLGILTPARSGPFAPPAEVIPYPYTNVAVFIPGDYTWLYPGLLLAPIFVILMSCIYHRAPEEKRIFGQIGLSFALIYATIIMIDYFIQLAVVEPSILSGETAGLSLFTQYNPHGLFIALECLAYLIMSASLVSIAPIFMGGRLERSVRWLYVSGFVLVIAALVGLVLFGQNFVAFEVVALLINWIVLIVSGVLLSILFQRGLR